MSFPEFLQIVHPYKVKQLTVAVPPSFSRLSWCNTHGCSYTLLHKPTPNSCFVVVFNKFSLPKMECILCHVASYDWENTVFI